MSKITHEQLEGASSADVQAMVYAMNEDILNRVAKLTDETGMMLHVEVALQPIEGDFPHSQYTISTKIVGTVAVTP